METLRDIEMNKIEAESQNALIEFVNYLNKDENMKILEKWGILPYRENHITLSYIQQFNSLFYCMGIRLGMLYDKMCSGDFVSDDQFKWNTFSLHIGRIENRYRQFGLHSIKFQRDPWMFIDMPIYGEAMYRANIDGIISLYINNYGTWSREFVKYLNVNYGITMSNLLPKLFHLVVD